MANTRDIIGEQACLDALIADEMQNFEDSDVTKVKFLNNKKSLITVNLPNATRIESNGLNECSLLNEVNAPNVVYIGDNAFTSDYSLEKLVAGSIIAVNSHTFLNCMMLHDFTVGSSIRSLYSQCFAHCKSLCFDDVDFSSVASMSGDTFNNSSFGKIILPNSTNLGNYTGAGTRTSVVDLGKSISLGNNKFNGAESLCHLILRGVSNVVTLSSNALSSTGLYNGMGWIYVPENLVDNYKANSNWSRYASQIVAIDEYPKKLQNETVSDSWSTIVESTTYATDYPIGSIKYLNVGGTEVAMMLVATDTDDLVSGGKARMTWMCKNIFELFSMNVVDQISACDWETCKIRYWLRNIIYPQIDPIVKNAIKNVNKTYLKQSVGTLTISDNLWIPSYREIYSTTGFEDSGCDYTSVFNNSTSRIKYCGLSTIMNAWWTRSNYNKNSFRTITAVGGTNNSGLQYFNGVIFGFCV